jgi:signal transduction histidine kinase/ActR/RegA family two-component response regulator
VRRTEDELGVLVDTFNSMLDRIQSRETELSKANDELRHEVAERKRAEQERAELLVREREANRLKDEFLATLSHELRTPLNAILGWTKLLRGKALPAQSVDQALEKVERNALMQARLVEDLLEVSRITTGKMRLDTREIDLVALATIAIDSIRPVAEARGVTLETAFSTPSLSTAGDPDRLQQVIWNLLSNAVKFTPAGGSARIAIHRRGEVDEIVVSDTGIGIDPGFLPSVFETFRQAEASATRTYGGLGLGLSIVRNLVELHGGSVDAFSAGAGRGSTFTVRLPVRDLVRTAPPASSAARFDATALSGYRILVVEDQSDTRQLIETALVAGGAAVFAASSADEALELWRRERPHALISDIAMPGRDGYSLMRQIRSAGPAQTPRVTIALSAYAAPQDHQRSIDAGFQRHLTKPVDPVALVETLRELLDATAPSTA